MQGAAIYTVEFTKKRTYLFLIYFITTKGMALLKKAKENVAKGNILKVLKKKSNFIGICFIAFIILRFI